MPVLLERMAAFNWKYAVIGLVVLAAGTYVALGRGGSLGPTLTIVPNDFREQVNVSGTVTAAKTVDLGFASSGRIIGTYARVGQHVGAGAILAETDNGDLAAMVAQKQAKLDSLLAGTRPEQVAVAAAAVANAEAALMTSAVSAYTSSDDAVHNKLDPMFTNPRVSPELSFTMTNATLGAALVTERLAIESVLSQWATLTANLSTGNAEASAIKAQTYIAKITTLLADANSALNQGVADGKASAATLASYSTALATARTNVNAASTALTNALSALTDAEKSLTLSQAGPTAADVAAAQADVQNARALLAKTRVVAPFSGVVTRMDAKTGEIVSPSTSDISMQSDGVFEIETYIPEVAIAHVTPGNAATTTLDAYGQTASFPSTVVSVDPAETVKEGVPTYKTMLAFKQADARIRSGMTANVSIETRMLPNAIVIPAGAVGLDAKGTYVSVVRGKDVAKQYVVTGGTPALGQTLIASGLSSGDIILLSPQ